MNVAAASDASFVDLNRSKRKRRLAAVAVCVVCLLCGAWWFWARSAATTAAKHLAAEARSEFKLVVATTVRTIELSKESKNDDWWEKIKSYISSSSVRVRVIGCQVQWTVPLNGLSEDSVSVSLFGDKIMVTLPAPVVDTEFVDIPADVSNWEVYKDGGWLRWDKSRLESELRNEVRKALIDRETQNGLDEAFKITAKVRAEAFLKKIVQAHNSKADVEVQWKR